MAEPARAPHDVSLWPLNLHLGYGVVSDYASSAGGLTIGLDALTLNYAALSVDTLSIRMLLRDACAHQSERCGVSGDVFLGTRIGYARYWGERQMFQGAIGLGVGIGDVGMGWSDRQPLHDGEVLLSPSIRLSLHNLLGLELSTLMPIARRNGAAYPMVWMVNVLGGGGILLLAFY